MKAQLTSINILYILPNRCLKQEGDSCSLCCFSCKLCAHGVMVNTCQQESWAPSNLSRVLENKKIP